MTIFVGRMARIPLREKCRCDLTALALILRFVTFQFCNRVHQPCHFPLGVMGYSFTVCDHAASTTRMLSNTIIYYGCIAANVVAGMIKFLYVLEHRCKSRRGLAVSVGVRCMHVAYNLGCVVTVSKFVRQRTLL